MLSIGSLLANLPCQSHSTAHLYRRGGGRGLGDCIRESLSTITSTSGANTNLAQTFATIFKRFPTYKLWKMKRPGHCVSKYKYFLGTAVPEVITDFVILAMPLPYIWNLQMKLRQKLLLSIVFILGL